LVVHSQAASFDPEPRFRFFEHEVKLPRYPRNSGNYSSGFKNAQALLRIKIYRL